MSERVEAIRIAKEILQPNSDAQWAAPLAREFLARISDEDRSGETKEPSHG